MRDFRYRGKVQIRPPYFHTPIKTINFYMIKKSVKIFVITFLFLTPLIASAATPSFYYAGWLPFWKKTAGAMDVALNLEKIHEISPFSYEVNSKTGALVDKLKIHEGLWRGWLPAARDMGVKIIPSIAWFDGDGIHKLLSNTKKRRAHEDAIAKLVKDEKFDGIDIDYEAKKAETNPYFSLFIKGLWMRLPVGKILSCTIETRMPADSRYTKTADPNNYANDYAVLNKYCDQIRIMTYDQGVIDVKLDAQKGNGKLYAPVSDPDWAEKIIKEAIKTISRKKIMLGVPTYGYEYEVTWANGLTTYRRLRSVNYTTAMSLAEWISATPARNSAGELSYIYSSSTLIEVSPALRWIVSSTPPDVIPTESLNSSTSITRFVSFTDAEAIRQKIQLAKKYKLRGVAIFKLDGEADPAFWSHIK